MREQLKGENSRTPEYFRIFNGEEVSLNAIKEDPAMAVAFLTLVRIKQLVGQMTLDGDVIYQPLPPHEVVEPIRPLLAPPLPPGVTVFHRPDQNFMAVSEEGTNVTHIVRGMTDPTKAPGELSTIRLDYTQFEQ